LPASREDFAFLETLRGLTATEITGLAGWIGFGVASPMIGETGACPDVAVGVGGSAATGVGELVSILFSFFMIPGFEARGGQTAPWPS
jgi:hypothetical protein